MRSGNTVRARLLASRRKGALWDPAFKTPRRPKSPPGRPTAGHPARVVVLLFSPAVEPQILDTNRKTARARARASRGQPFAGTYATRKTGGTQRRTRVDVGLTDTVQVI